MTGITGMSRITVITGITGITVMTRVIGMTRMTDTTGMTYVLTLLQTPFFKLIYCESVPTS